MRLKWQDSENGATTKKVCLTVAGSQIQYRQAGQKDILTIMSSWIPLERLIALIYINEVKIDAKKTL